MDAILAGLILVAIVIGPVAIVALIIGVVAIVYGKDDLAELALKTLGKISMNTIRKDKFQPSGKKTTRSDHV